MKVKARIQRYDDGNFNVAVMLHIDRRSVIAEAGNDCGWLEMRKAFVDALGNNAKVTLELPDPPRPQREWRASMKRGDLRIDVIVKADCGLSKAKATDAINEQLAPLRAQDWYLDEITPLVVTP